VYAAEMFSRLIGLAQRRVRNGAVTERGLAKLCGISQPHMHNVLKEIRSLSNDSADRLMKALDITIADLMWSAGGDQGMNVRAVPFLRSRLGPGADADLAAFRGVTPVAAYLLEDVVDAVAARLTPDIAMPESLAANDLVLLDQSVEARRSPRGDAVWIVDEGDGLRVRYVRRGGNLLYTASEVTRHDRMRWRAIGLSDGSILGVVKARVAWISRRIEPEI
jgi:Cro/C1-type HTH DNA-binding domain